MPREFDKVKPQDEQAEFVHAFCQQSYQDGRQDMDDIWDEVEENFLVRSDLDTSLSRDTANPLSVVAKSKNPDGYAVLKDPETHQEVVTIASNIVLAIFPDDRFIQARGVGFEDIFKGEAVSKLEEYYYRRPGQYLTNVEWVLGTCIYGTQIKEVGWLYREELRSVRQLDMDPLTGETYSTDSVQPVVVADDPDAEVIDCRDFFPDTGSNRIDRMFGAAKRFRITATEALNRVARGIYDKEMVDRAIDARQSTDAREQEQKRSQSSTSLGHRAETNPDLIYLTGYEYIGQTPFKLNASDPNYGDVIVRNVITTLCGFTVRGALWPRSMPWIDARILPRLGSFWGISPGEVIRYDQDFADTLKMMLADAVTRATHPPHIYDVNAQVQLAKLREFRPGLPIGANRIDAIQQVPYNPPVQHAFTMYSGVKGQMREATGALGSVQGLGLGINRASATEADRTFQAAFNRPDLFASIIEKDALPREAKYVLELYREMLPENDPAELSRRIGESATPVSLSDIMPEFDIKFVGSRHEGGRQNDIAAFREIVQASANPIVNQVTPWIPLLRAYFERIGAPEIAAQVGNPEMVAMHTALTQLATPTKIGGNGNGEIPATPLPTTSEAQAFGGAIQ